ncbi:MAG: DUF58 domain-containing protein [Candidatus Jettenia sp.]|uniref:VWFA domain-containing protein n=1 Tax=Candidatus Jettenia caeni TaxID=247490 RepID=I3IL59_9BACT|nr:DUF58 domain-containing protein [Candidatus Jettenia sp. AMX1]MBC6930385.1 DUF58 domain-containing protein [Candidatus Jettenia sp.]NUN24717.1 DUF58 domain-containing protein [Candidatus Jettenia caeni]KAA0247027.1 MAG: DUF58 domain-containing protein [Candidatus Jettenia sp. AMX1]MCE7881973.1 DUF58 domain-containing protein [Candidatus Jettenia sp. AMX1]MCQ3928566.1 DUF58 domain-containing protein [Candidatus Jettenia sp.]
MISKDILKKIQQVEIHTRRLVNEAFVGEYHSVFKGRGMEFDEVREYQPGDEIRTIDWNVTARMGRPFIKRYVEERELTVMLLVDVSASGNFGSIRQLKNEVAIEICALLAFSAIKNNDKVGLIMFTNTVEKFIPPKKGQKHVLRVIRELLCSTPAGKGTNIPVALEYLNKISSRRTISFVVSDFIANDYAHALRIANKKHDVIAITIVDPREQELPDVGFIELKDAESGEVILVDTAHVLARKEFHKMKSRQIQERSKLFRSMGVDEIVINTNKHHVEPIVRFFRMRENRY